ncbi:MAG: hypothetical protein HQM11_11800 [SAR324 cluster bacterium]|nr:hypothetical protein [SAR324 cluster bacterium]
MAIKDKIKNAVKMCLLNMEISIASASWKFFNESYRYETREMAIVSGWLNINSG